MMNYINHKSKVNASIYFEDICTKPNADYSLPTLPSVVWIQIFNCLENFNPYQKWELRALCKDFKYGISPLKNSYIVINKQKELDKFLISNIQRIPILKTLPDIFLSEGTFSIVKQLKNIKVKIYGKGIGKTIIYGGIKSHNSKIHLDNLTISDGEYGIMSYCDVDPNISTPIKLFFCEICYCKTSICLFESNTELNNCIIHSNKGSFHITDSNIKVNDSIYYHDGEEIKRRQPGRLSRYRHKRIEFNNSKIVHKSSPLTNIEHTEEMFTYDSDGDREFEGYYRKFTVKSNRNIWQMWLNTDFKLKNRLSFYKDNSYLFETDEYYLDNIEDLEDILTNDNVKSKFIAVTDIDRNQFCDIINNLLETIGEEDPEQFLRFSQFSKDMIYLIWVYVNTPSNAIKNIPTILTETKHFYFNDRLKKYLKFPEYELFTFLKVLFLTHGFRVIGSGIKTAICNNTAEFRDLHNSKAVRSYRDNHTSYNESINTKLLWSKEVYNSKKSQMRKRRKKLMKHKN